MNEALSNSRQRRPGGRTAEVTRRINEAVLSLLIEGGIDACTFQNVAAKAGIERSTLYRRSPDRWPTIIDAIIEFADRATPVADTGSFRDDLRLMLHRLRIVLAGPLGPPVMGVAAALQGGAAPDQSERFWANRRKQLAPMFDAAIARGELAPDVNWEQLFAMAAGPLFFYAFVIGREADDATIETIVDTVVDRYGSQAVGPA